MAVIPNFDPGPTDWDHLPEPDLGAWDETCLLCGARLAPGEEHDCLKAEPGAVQVD